MTRSPPFADYWQISRQPLTSLCFIFPFLLVYELGVLWPGSVGLRNGADLWMRHTLLDAGIAILWVFPLLAPAILCAWHSWEKRPWSCHYEVLAGMFAESLLFAMLLVTAGRFVHMAIPANLPGSLAPRAISFLGAGIYEELLFRLILLPVVYGLLRLVRFPKLVAISGSVVCSSLLFAAAHHVDLNAVSNSRELADVALDVYTNPLYWRSFNFRIVAGALFSVLFWLRGFGITAGCHLMYDLIVGVLLGSLPSF